jgi:phospholipase C
MFGRYGVRVPAIIVSPWIEPRTVSHTAFDHTSIIKTILTRFCPQALQHVQPAEGRRARPHPSQHYPGLRVAQASHLGELLNRDTPRPAPPRDLLVQKAAARAAQTGTSLPQPLPQEQADPPLNDLQKSILAATRQLRRDGHPPNTP